MRVSYVTWTWGERLSTKYNAHTLAVGWRGVGARCPLMYKPARADQSRSARAQAPPLRGLMLPAVMGSNRKIGVSEGLEQTEGSTCEEAAVAGSSLERAARAMVEGANDTR